MNSNTWASQRLLSLLLVAVFALAHSTTPIVFQHIPKTAGTSLSIAFENRWAAEGCKHIDINNDIEVSGLADLAQKTHSQNRPGFKCLSTRLYVGPDRNDRATFARKIIEGRLPPVTYLAGHLPHGFCTFMPSGCR
jgi:hypothetical protein